MLTYFTKLTYFRFLSYFDTWPSRVSRDSTSGQIREDLTLRFQKSESWKLEVGNRFNQLCTSSPLQYQGPGVICRTKVQSWLSVFWKQRVMSARIRCMITVTSTDLVSAATTQAGRGEGGEDFFDVMSCYTPLWQSPCQNILWGYSSSLSFSLLILEYWWIIAFYTVSAPVSARCWDSQHLG